MADSKDADRKQADSGITAINEADLKKIAKGITELDKDSKDQVDYEQVCLVVKKMVIWQAQANIKNDASDKGPIKLMHRAAKELEPTLRKKLFK